MAQKEPLDEFTVWLNELTAAYKEARAERLMELNGSRAKRWSGDLHTYSYLWGRIVVLQPPWLMDAMAEAPALLGVGPTALREAAEADAYREFVERVSRA